MRKTAKNGFSLLEMGIVLLIISVLTAGSIAIFSASISRQQRTETLSKLQLIQKTLADYFLINGRIPCPADAEYTFDGKIASVDPVSGNFGIEAANAGACVAGTPAANQASGENVLGMVPTKTLRLPDDMAIDGWGRRIAYAVDRRMTDFDQVAVTGMDDATVRFTVNDTSGTARTTQAAYVLISYGPNGHGAYPRSGGVTRIDANSENANEQENCDCDEDVAEAALDGVFVQGPPTEDSANIDNAFDDMVAYGTRFDLRTPRE